VLAKVVQVSKSWCNYHRLKSVFLDSYLDFFPNCVSLRRSWFQTAVSNPSRARFISKSKK